MIEPIVNFRQILFMQIHHHCRLYLLNIRRQIVDGGQGWTVPQRPADDKSRNVQASSQSVLPNSQCRDTSKVPGWSVLNRPQPICLRYFPDGFNVATNTTDQHWIGEIKYCYRVQDVGTLFHVQLFRTAADVERQ
jgi:hypothetical protein